MRDGQSSKDAGIIDRRSRGTGQRPAETKQALFSPRLDDDAALRGLNSSSVAACAMENSGEQAVTEAHAEVIAPFRQSDGSYRVEASFRCLLVRL